MVVVDVKLVWVMETVLEGVRTAPNASVLSRLTLSVV
jgi:hypothetical protein